ncbi:hypothetical protein OBBRIDRAFT_603260 [Obba rivulosa]|uniref:Uncharacterized protein n=1 Tax=Obba rivulosa TaxID=1052685 RepID=A0A8E2AYH3_9APHY|nr:hypothetical protein OBBRIDRAFT_603260 [Obba rivulosa]
MEPLFSLTNRVRPHEDVQALKRREVVTGLEHRWQMEQAAQLVEAGHIYREAQPLHRRTADAHELRGEQLDLLCDDVEGEVFESTASLQGVVPLPRVLHRIRVDMRAWQRQKSRSSPMSSSSGSGYGSMFPQVADERPERGRRGHEDVRDPLPLPALAHGVDRRQRPQRRAPQGREERVECRVGRLDRPKRVAGERRDVFLARVCSGGVHYHLQVLDTWERADELLENHGAVDEHVCLQLQVADRADAG